MCTRAVKKGQFHLNQKHFFWYISNKSLQDFDTPFKMSWSSVHQSSREGVDFSSITLLQPASILLNHEESYSGYRASGNNLLVETKDPRKDWQMRVRRSVSA